MIVCPNCGRENENHYKFCLGCGTELSAADAQPTNPPVATPDVAPKAAGLKTPAPAPIAIASTPLPGDMPAPPTALPMASPVRQGSPILRDDEPATPTTQPIFDSQAPTEAPPAVVAERPDLDAESQIGTLNRGAFVNLPDPTVIGEDRFSAVSAPRNCRACNVIVPEGFKFCGVCGTRYEPPAVATPVARTRKAELILIHPDGTEGERVMLSGGDTPIGRKSETALFAEDPFLSPRHATLHMGEGRMTLRDEGSLNGVFVRLTHEVELSHRDMFRVGQQLLRFEDMRHVAPLLQPADDGTVTYGSPNRGTWGRLATIVAPESVAEVWTLSGDVVHLGRERGDVLFPHDGFVSGAHCRISTRQGRFFLEDPGSTNGTYYRIKGEYTLRANDLLLLGQQLFRFDLT